MKEQIEKYLRQLAPHQNEREGPQLLRGAVAKIDRLEDAIRLTLDENGHLADGDVCTLIRLKLAIEPPNVEVTGAAGSCRVQRNEVERC